MQKIYSLQYLRAFAAIWVLLTHVLQLCDVRPNDVFWAGQWGVDIFFLLSGFIIYLTTKEESSWIDFGIKRIFRIYPAYLLILTFYLLYKTSFSLNMNELIGGNLKNLICNILMLPISGPITTKSLIVGQAWSTVFELYFYFLFAILLLFKKPKRYIVFFIVICSFVGYGYRFAGFLFDGVLGFLSSVMGSSHNLFFVEGVLLAICYKNGWLKICNKILYCMLFVAMISIYIWCMTHTYNQVYSILLSPFVFVGVLLLNDFVKKESWWNKVLSFLGDISFSIYLVHCLIIRIIMNNMGIGNLYAVIVLSLLLTIMASSVIYLLVEKRFINLAKQLVKRRKIIS